MRQPRKPLAGFPYLFRRRDVSAAGITRNRLNTLVRKGSVERIAWGLYRRKNVSPNENETMAIVAKKVPAAIVCLLTALRYYEIGTQSPREIWIALDYKARKPKPNGYPVRVVRFSGPMLRYGILTKQIQGVPFRITSPARTVVDCFRYRNKIGIDVALEALTDAIRSRRATVDEIVRAAEVCRVRTIIKPYLQAVLG